MNGLRTEAALARAFGPVHFAARERISAPFVEKSPPRRPLALVAEDDDSVRRLIVATLSSRFSVVAARDGEEALEAARRERPDLAVLDVLMPRKDGYEVCRALKEDPETRRAKVMILTALHGSNDRAKVTEAGGDIFFTKPFSPRVLLAAAAGLLALEG